ncbi:MAG: pyrimidine-nucleoside phosphorylase [Bacillaceae bacterium]|nr:pyrimidine-nucleoside phosphorylase [Bacillaceae bacterium]
MRMVDIIHKKRNGKTLTEDEIRFMIEGFTRDEIPDYQMSAWAMAVYFRGMTDEETAYLTRAMVESGDQVDLSAIEGIKVDKHSTGGVGDTTTLVLAPLVASAGVPVAKMSGRGLGHTGGTIDKLESIPGFQVELSQNQFVDRVNRHKIAVVGQSADLTPADKKLYALRDVTATVESIPLIASSIMSKKIAAGADAIVLDVKTGNGAFMKTPEKSEELARAMVAIGKKIGRKTVAVISDMNQPLGRAIGNALEVKEAIATLKGRGPADLTELCLILGAQMLVLGGRADSEAEARRILENSIQSGKAVETFRQFVQGQGGNPDVVDNPELLPSARYIREVTSEQAGVIQQIDTEALGTLAMKLGAGRETRDSKIDQAAGIEMCKKINDRVNKGETIAILHSNYVEINDNLINETRTAFRFSEQGRKEIELIYKIIHD